MTAAEVAFRPYPGLRPYEPDEAHLFFGRDQQVQELLRRLRVNRFLAVVGTSGSGKSSLVRAGLIPALYGGFMAGAGSSWRIAIMKPGAEPLRNLAGALCAPEVFGDLLTGSGTDDIAPELFAETTLHRGPLGLIEFAKHARLPAGESLLIVVDQFEEVFRFRSSAAGREDDATALVKLLLEASRQRDLPLFVLLTMRSDFLGDCPRFRNLPEAINDGQYLVPRLTRDQIRDAITGPARVGGAEVAPRLVQRLLSEVGEDPDQLPQLQHALMRTWDVARHDAASGPLDVPHYEQTGGIANALSLHADDAFAALPDDLGREIARKLFQRLTEKGERYRDVRRPAAFEDVCADAAAPPEKVAAVVDIFRAPDRSFLMPPVSVALNADTVLDISHESLIRVWSRLQGWVDDEARAAVIWRRLVQSAEWRLQGEASLLVEPELSRTVEWWNAWNPTAAWAERYHGNFESVQEFVEESRRADEARQAADREREVREAEDAERRSHLEAVRVIVAYFQTIPAEEVAAIRELLSRMADPDTGAYTPVPIEAPAIPAPLAAKLAEAPPPFFSVEPGATGRLTTIRVTDAALLSEAWPPSKDWMSQDQPLIRFRRELAVLVNAWESSGRDARSQLPAAMLDRAVRMAASFPGRLNPAESDFIEASRSGALRPRWWVLKACVVVLLCIVHGLLIARSAYVNADVTRVLQAGSIETVEALEQTRQAYVTAHAFADKGAPIQRRWDMLPWGTIDARLRERFLAAFRFKLYEPSRNSLIASLQALPASPAPTDDYQTAYENLKAYLILTTRPDLAAANATFLKSVLFRSWSEKQVAAPELRTMVERQFDTFAEILRGHPFHDQPDAVLIQRARAYLGQFSLVDWAYQVALSTDVQAPLRFAEFLPGSQALLSVPHAIPRAFEGGNAGWSRTLSVIKRSPERMSAEMWVLGDTRGRAIDENYLTAQLQERFVGDCVTQWRMLLTTAQVQPFASLSDAANKLRELSGPGSPLEQFLKMVVTNTNLYNQRVNSAFQPVRVPMSEYFEALSRLSRAVDEAARPGGSRRSGLEELQSVRAEIQRVTSRFDPSSDVGVQKAVTALLEQPVQYAANVLERGAK